MPVPRRRQPRRQAPAKPLTDRGRRTRHALLTAAREVFERDGYLSARVTDIAEAAQVSTGTFYTYFDTKEDIFREVAYDLAEEMFRTPDRGDDDGADRDPIARIERANLNFVRFYRANADLLAIFEQVATFNHEFIEMRRRVRDRSVARAARGIRELQAAGLADRALDPQLTASALVSMVSNFVYSWIVLGEPHDEEAAIAHLSTLWARAIGLPEPDGDRSRPPS